MYYPSVQMTLRRVALRRASKVTFILVLIGLVTFLGCLSWWIHDNRLSSPWLLALFVIFGVYGGVQLVGSWVLYIAATYVNQHNL